MKFTLSKEILDKFPKASIGCLVVKNIDTSGKNLSAKDETYQVLWDQIEKTAVETLRTEIDTIKEVKEWHDALTMAGFDPDEDAASHTALIRRIKAGKEIPSIHPLVNIYNTISLRHKTPLGGHDIDRIDGDIIVGPNTKELPFIEMGSSKKTAISKSEIVYADSSSVLTRKWVWRQSDTSKITDKTTSFFVPIDDLGNRTPEEIKQIALDIKALVQKYAATDQTEFMYDIINSKTNTIDLNKLPKLTGTSKTKIIHTQPIKRDPEIIRKLTTRAVETIVPSTKMLENMLLSGRRLRVYQGFDPTAPTLHIGHSAGMRKLRYFQQLGHHVIFLIGDFTGRIGDPTDKSSARQKLTKEQVEENLKLYIKQASRILDFKDKQNPVEILYNSHWLDKMSFADVVELAAEFTVQQMLKRDMFQERLKEDRPIYIHEFMYPLMQGYDSVEMNIDVEVGGNDQMFNMICGRDLVLKRLNKEKVVLPNKLLTDPTGKKMGKSEGNMIMLNDTPEDIYGKVMAYTDGMICPAYEILTEVPMEEIKQMVKDMKAEKVNPMDLKKRLAFLITSEHKGEKAAKKAEGYFESVFQNKGQEAEIPTIQVSEKEARIIDLIVKFAKFTNSNSQAKRLIKQGAVSIDDKKINDINTTSTIKPTGITLRAGKQIVKITST